MEACVLVSCFFLCSFLGFGRVLTSVVGDWVLVYRTLVVLDRTGSSSLGRPCAIWEEEYVFAFFPA